MHPAWQLLDSSCPKGLLVVAYNWWHPGTHEEGSTQILFQDLAPDLGATDSAGNKFWNVFSNGSGANIPFRLLSLALLILRRWCLLRDAWGSSCHMSVFVFFWSSISGQELLEGGSGKHINTNKAATCMSYCNSILHHCMSACSSILVLQHVCTVCMYMQYGC